MSKFFKIFSLEKKCSMEQGPLSCIIIAGSTVATDDWTKRSVEIALSLVIIIFKYMQHMLKIYINQQFSSRLICRHEGGKSSVPARSSAPPPPKTNPPTGQARNMSKKRRKPSERNVDPFQNIGFRVQR